MQITTIGGMYVLLLSLIIIKSIDLQIFRVLGLSS
jgi:hypothetical protein